MVKNIIIIELLMRLVKFVVLSLFFFVLVHFLTNLRSCLYRCTMLFMNMFKVRLGCDFSNMTWCQNLASIVLLSVQVSFDQISFIKDQLGI